jgi:hypothetical protein
MTKKFKLVEKITISFDIKLLVGDDGEPCWGNPSIELSKEMEKKVRKALKPLGVKIVNWDR